MNHQEIKDAISAYCLGALEPDERESVETHLQQGCRECEALLQEMRLVVDALPFSAAEKSPPPSLKQKILTAVQPEIAAVEQPSDKATTKARPAPVLMPERANRRWLSISWALSAALVVVIAGSIWYTNRLQSQIDMLYRQMQMSDRIVAELRDQLRERQQLITVFTSPALRMVELDGQEAAPQASGKVYLDQETREAVFAAINMPKPPPDKDYQLWMLVGAKPVDAGVFKVDASGDAITKLPTISSDVDLSAFAVTLEPKGGVPQPTGEMYLLGALKV